MLDLPGQPLLDKDRLIGTCSRLPIAVDTARIRAEIADLPPQSWNSPAGRVGVHRMAEAVFLRGHAPADGEHPIEDREVLARLPRTRELIASLVDAPLQRCLLARLPPGLTIAPHRDDGAPYFGQTLRIHVPVATHDRAFMMCGETTFVMRAGEVWALNNGAVHAVWNAHRTLPRTHLICDYLPSAPLCRLLARAQRGLSRSLPLVDAHFAAFLGAPATETA
jgi:Aspartyl/Asparaginyl beta-hydroxylase